MDERDFEAALYDLLATLADWEADDLERLGLRAALPFEGVRVRTYEDAGLLTKNRGLVVTLDDGTEFQVTIVQARGGGHG